MIVQMKNLEDAISDMKNGKYDFTKTVNVFNAALAVRTIYQ